MRYIARPFAAQLATPRLPHRLPERTRAGSPRTR